MPNALFSSVLRTHSGGGEPVPESCLLTAATYTQNRAGKGLVDMPDHPHYIPWTHTPGVDCKVLLRLTYTHTVHIQAHP